MLPPSFHSFCGVLFLLFIPLVGSWRSFVGPRSRGADSSRDNLHSGCSLSKRRLWRFPFLSPVFGAGADTESPNGPLVERTFRFPSLREKRRWRIPFPQLTGIGRCASLAALLARGSEIMITAERATRATPFFLPAFLYFPPVVVVGPFSIFFFVPGDSFRECFLERFFRLCSACARRLLRLFPLQLLSSA